MKKLLTLVMALVLALTAVGVMAEGWQDMPTVTIKNVYEAANEGTRSPEEAFAFEISAQSVTDAAEGVTVETMPVPTVASVSYAAGEAGSATKEKDIVVTLPDYDSVGVYTYAIRPVRGSSAGVKYLENDIRLVVTVIEQDGKIRVAAVHTETADGELAGSGKSDTVTLVYSAGRLAVTKTVKGNLGDRSRYFDITVTLTGEEGKTYAESYAVSGGSHADNPESIEVGTPTLFRLKDGETITVLNLPYGVTYAVSEADYSEDGYETGLTYSDEAKKVDSASDSVTVTNTKEKGIDTGINTDSLPYFILMAVALAGLMVLVLRKRADK